MTTPPTFIPECHVDTALARALLLHRADFNDFINHKHGVPKVAAEMKRQWELFGLSRRVVGLVDDDKRLAEVAYTAEFRLLPNGVGPNGLHSIRQHPERRSQFLIVLNPACDTWVWEAATAAGLLPADQLPADYWDFIAYCKTKGIENDGPLKALLADIRRVRPAVYAGLGDFVGQVMDPEHLLP